MKLLEFVTSIPKRREKRWLKIECDRCHKVFDTAFTCKYAEQAKHYCTRQCSQAEHYHLRMAASVSAESIAKRKATTMARFGVECMFSLPHVHALVNTPEKSKQRHETMKRNGSYFNSSSEHAFFAHLVCKFGQENVERQAVINKWPIDFYVKTIDAYVQFDGEYWHGLDRPLENIAKFATPRDKTILRKFQIDREQDVWFQTHHKTFIRVTDKQFQRNNYDNRLL